MIDKTVLLAHFWANANKLVSLDGVEIDLHGDDIVVVSATLKNTAGQPCQVQLTAQFTLDAFIEEMETQAVEEVTEINLDLLFVLLLCRKAGYHVMKV